ncbi:MAG: hypothetical protein ACI8RA_001434, partial [Chlamydiales bacterium]
MRSFKCDGKTRHARRRMASSLNPLLCVLCDL